MEKQQEILFSIVSESKNNLQRHSYPPQNVPVNSMSYHIDPFMRMSSEQKPSSLVQSAFKPSKPGSSPTEIQRGLVTPMPHQAQNTLNRFGVGRQGNNNLSQVQLLSEICNTLLSKQM